MTDYERSGPFVNGSLPAVNDDALNNMDEGIDLAHSEIEALAALVATKIGLPASPTDGDVLTYSGGAWIAEPVEVPSGIPTGTSLDFYGSTLPSGYLWEDGSAVSRTTYAALFAEIGTTYGAGDGTTTFNVPNSLKRVKVGKDATDTAFDTLGETGGAKEVTLTTAEMPVHSHGVTDPGHSHRVPVQQNDFNTGGTDTSHNSDLDYGFYTMPATTGITIQNAGSGGAHSNLQPYIVCNRIIKT